jgi:VanZ family protein
MRLAKLWLPVVLWAALILSASNDSFSSHESRGWLENFLGHDFPELVNHAVRKAGHVFFYGVLGALAFRADRRLFAALGVVALVASVDEYRQSLTSLRTGTSWDVMLDVCSALLVILAIRRR